MTMLIAGIALFFVIHLILSIVPAIKLAIVDAIGKGAFRGIFSLFVLSSLALIVFGWRSSGPIFVYEPPVWGRHIAMALVLVACILLVSGPVPTNIKRYIRHPQLAAVMVWAIAHLLANGDNKSIILFGSFAVWALIETFTISAREGSWIKEDRKSLAADGLAIAAGIVLYGILLLIHPYITGITILFTS